MPIVSGTKILVVAIQTVGHAAAIAILFSGIMTAITACADEGTQSGLTKIDFDRHVRPILSDACFGCHGPDSKARQADLRLDERQGLFARLDDGPVVKPGDAKASELMRRITSTDDSLRMPPPKSERKLSYDEIEVLRRWIEAGAQWQSHWAFDERIEQALPQTDKIEDSANPLDVFINQRLGRERLATAPASPRESLIRRLSFDLTGLPPQIEEVDAFVADRSPVALERLVDRLLASPRFGERMAIDWLDGARYADTSGYQNDGPRSMWRWRDWVIDAFNRNLAFDQFTIEQIAGDLLPNARLDQHIATGFQRNHRGNAEGGIVPAEFAVEYVVDRIETTAAVWLGLTIGCARCHDHKYDPISQKEFYQLFAFFNNIPEHGRAIKEGNSPPYLPAPTHHEQLSVNQLEQQVAAAEKRWSELQPILDKLQTDWERTLVTEYANTLRGQSDPDISARIHETSHAQRSPSSSSVSFAKGAFFDGHWYSRRGLQVVFDGRIAQPNATFDSYVSDFDFASIVPKSGSSTVGAAPVSSTSTRLDGTNYIEVGEAGRFGYFDKFTLAAWIAPEKPQGTILSRMLDVAQSDGYYLILDKGRLQLNLVKRWLDDALRVETISSIPIDRWTHVAVSYDGSRKASGVRFFINGQLQESHVNLDQLNQTFLSPQPLRIGGGNGPENRFVGNIGVAQVYDRVLDADEIAALSVPEPIARIASLSSEKRSPGQRAKLAAYFIEHIAGPELTSALESLQRARQDYARRIELLPSVMVMRELDRPLMASILSRGQYDQPMESVAPDVPKCLPPMDAQLPRNRLGLAKWLVSQHNPLPSRVIVNRYWQMFFGVGLVKTSEDFGTQGERPSHPELLDWLAGDFVRSGWDLKRLIRTIVTSRAYQRSSAGPIQSWTADPENRLLWRGPRFRLPAELIRDAALSASGLLTEQIGGPSIKPYQPDVLWGEIATDTEYERSVGADLYRRSLYVYWKRTVAPPTMQTLDAPSRETCVIRRPITNTPLQALLLMNEEGFLESARLLGQRAILEGSSTLESRLQFAFRTVLARKPTPLELNTLVRCWRDFRSRYDEFPETARLALSTGAAATVDELNVAELAAYAAACSLILNLDEAVTKE